ncbi:MAG: hypothetical protein M1812_006324 [Candelaria pacifica]|nr:MAG: hypothetical protein M1812_006324 [Candelaria pacifica]
MAGRASLPSPSGGSAAPSQGRGTSRPSQRQGADSSAGSGRTGPDPEMMRLQILGDPRMRQEIQNQNPELANVVENPERFREVWNSLQRQQAEADLNRQREFARLNEDPFNLENQTKIEEMIRQEAVMENLQNALEHNPEAFGKVHMLYIDVEVNGHKVKAFVDSGAQATIMSPSCAEACGIMRLIDKRFAGTAVGVGTAKILGRVHSAQIKIGSLFLACSFTVMEGKDVDLLLGLDMLKRHQASIDLQRDRLVIRGVEVPFLGEADIPKKWEAITDEPTVEGPGGAKLGTQSGVVVAPEPQQQQGSSSSRSFQGQGQTLGTSPTPQPQNQSTTPRPQSSSTSHPPEAIEQLQQIGFSRQEAIAALNATDGNVELAAGLLFQG